MKRRAATLLTICALCSIVPNIASGKNVASSPESSLAEQFPSLLSIDFPGDPTVAALAREVTHEWATLHPEGAADAGLLVHGLHLPSFAPTYVAAHIDTLETLGQRLAAVPVAGLDIDDQIDLAVLQNVVQVMDHTLRVERRWTHRPGEWLEPVASLLLAHLSAPNPVPDAIPTLAAQLPAMLAEVEAEVTAPTRRDVDTATELLESIDTMLSLSPEDPRISAARAAVQTSRAQWMSRTDLPEDHMLGGEGFRWRLTYLLGLPWDAETLLQMAETDLAALDAQIAQLEANRPPEAPPTVEEAQRALALDQADVLRLYDEVVANYLGRLRAMGVLTVPTDLPPLRARPTPDALVPLTGDGGSMNPVPLFGPTEGAWWNVEHHDADMSYADRVGKVVSMQRASETWMGPYAVHEGVPGHHLQLSIARTHQRPVRRLFQNTASVEGWALYAESLFESNGGFEQSEVGRLMMLRSYRARVKRVVFDVKVETGVWTLQEAADWKHGAKPGEGKVDPELLRAVHWPTQLVSYYAGMKQIEAIKEECRAKWGDNFSETAFHDALLAEGPISLSLVRTALLAKGPPAP